MKRKGYVVILEEDPQIRSLVERWLGEDGYEMVRPGARAETPALVVANVPDPSSAEALIRSLREYAAPILLLSARFHSGVSGSVEAASRLGVTKVLPKPFSRKELLDAVRESIEG